MVHVKEENTQYVQLSFMFALVHTVYHMLLLFPIRMQSYIQYDTIIYFHILSQLFLLCTERHTIEQGHDLLQQKGLSHSDLTQDPSYYLSPQPTVHYEDSSGCVLDYLARDGHHLSVFGLLEKLM